MGHCPVIFSRATPLANARLRAGNAHEEFMEKKGQEIIVTTPDELHRVIVAALHSVLAAPGFLMPSKNGCML